MADETTEGTTSAATAPEPTTPTTDTTTPSAPAAESAPSRLPDDHPLVLAYNRVKGEAAEAKGKVREFEDRDKTDSQRAQEGLAEASRERDEALAEAARLRAAIDHGLTADDLELLGTGTPEEIEERAKRLAARLASGVRRPDPTLGSTGQTVADPDQWLREAARQ